MSAAPRIIVLGGSGETGRRIVDQLSRRYPGLCIASAARRAQSDPAEQGGQRAVRLDIRDRDRALAALAGYDLAIIALGPMHAYGDAPHRLCLEAGIDCIDINDHLGAADRILALHGQARSQGRSVFTGMGFTPGLSSLLLAQLAARRASANGRYCIRACMGAAYGGGESSPHAILSSFTQRITVLEDGKRRVQNTPWNGGQRFFAFPGQAKPVDTIPFSALETASLTSGRSTLAASVSRLDARYHIQYLKQGFARFMARCDFSPRTLDRFAKRFHASGQSMKRRKDADPDTVLWVYPDDAPQRGLLIQGMVSSYDLTALMACAVTDAWLAGELARYRGVHAVDQLAPETHESLVMHLARRGITSKTADRQALYRQGLYLGWVEPVSGPSVSSLRHFGRNWYTAVPMHPKMMPLQKRFLLESDIWAALRRHCAGPRFAGFILTTLLRWRNHYKALADFRDQAAGPLADKWKLVTRDISMFTSGYSRARDLLGQKEALRLYGRMFLETGRMEMRWLWTDASVFAAFDRPWRAVCDYWLAFMEGCQTLGVLRHTVRDEDMRVHCTIDHCAYGQMFGRLGCPELAPLVREMECEALRYIASASGLQVEWKSASDGSADVVLRSPAEV